MILYFDAELNVHPGVQKLKDAGHEIRFIDSEESEVRYFSKYAWNWSGDHMWPYMKIALKNTGKKAKAPKKAKKK